jgi:hypothetical protein
MPAIDHLQPRLFMQAKELYAMPSVEAAVQYGGDVDKMRSMKRADLAARPRIAKGMSASVHEPVDISLDNAFGFPSVSRDPHVADGNHRVLAAYDRNPDAYVPVVHHQTFDDWATHETERYEAGARDVNWKRRKK